MKNPYREQSKVNPQTEDGFRQIANEVFEALLASRLSKAEYKIIMAIIHFTWGFQKKDDCIPLSQFEEKTGLQRRTVTRAIARLKARRIIVQEQGGGSRPSRYMFNKHYDTWLGRDKMYTSGGRDKMHTRDTGVPTGRDKTTPLVGTKRHPQKKKEIRNNHNDKGRDKKHTTQREKTIGAYVNLYTPSPPGVDVPYREYPSQSILDAIELMAELWGDDVVQRAIQRAVEAGKSKVGPKYIEAIIKRWKKEGKVEPLLTQREYEHLRESR